MKTRIFLFIPLVLLLSFYARAELSPTKLETALQRGDAGSAEAATAMTEAIAISLLQTSSRIKLPGAGSFNLETGFQTSDIDHKSLYIYTDSLHSPSSFQSMLLKAGIGLPFGFLAEIGFTQVLSEHTMNAISASLSYQTFDFSSWVSTELVPSVTLDISGMRTLFGPGEFSFAGQLNLGIYNRKTFAQFGYLFRTMRSILTMITPSPEVTTFRHGLSLHVPFISNWFVRTEVLFPEATGLVMAGYRF